MASYIELLRDPRWQRKRLEILERDGWECQECGDKNKTLHVHHRIYQRGKKPWEYNGEHLTTLCVDCHESETVLDDRLKSWFADGHAEKMQILGYAEARAAIISGENVGVYSYENACGIADAIGCIGVDELVTMIRDGEVNPSKILGERKRG